MAKVNSKGAAKPDKPEFKEGYTVKKSGARPSPDESVAECKCGVQADSKNRTGSKDSTVEYLKKLGIPLDAGDLPQRGLLGGSPGRDRPGDRGVPPERNQTRSPGKSHDGRQN